MPSSSFAVLKQASTDHREKAIRRISRTVAPLRPGTMFETKYLISPVSTFRATRRQCIFDGSLRFIAVSEFSTFRQKGHHFTSHTSGPLFVSLIRYRCQDLSRNAGEYLARFLTSEECLGYNTFALYLRPRVSLPFLVLTRTTGSTAQPWKSDGTSPTNAWFSVSRSSKNL